LQADNDVAAAKSTPGAQLPPAKILVGVKPQLIKKVCASWF